MEYDLYPLLFEPVYKNYPWGGMRIPETFKRALPPGIYAESWEIADHDDGMSVVRNGEYTGMTLRELLRIHGRRILGSKVNGDRFPLLIKLIDAREKLSVQVHPNDETAARFGGDPKTEMWYLLGDNESQVFCGLRDGVTRASFLQAVAEKRSGETLRTVPVHKDSVVFVRGGSVHAIDAGCLILEIQQNSNTTYRIYDWGRMGNDGKPRELHIDQAMKVIDWNNRIDPLVEPELLSDSGTIQWWNVLNCAYFHLEKMVFSDSVDVSMDGTTFHALFVADGEAQLRWNNHALPAPAGTSILIPASLSTYELGGRAKVLRASVP